METLVDSGDMLLEQEGGIEGIWSRGAVHLMKISPWGNSCFRVNPQGGA